MTVLIFIASIFLLVEAQTDKRGECPVIQPVCKCAPRELCQKDQQCEKDQKCCQDCCGGHRCTDPVKNDNCTKKHEVFTDCGSACPPTCGKPQPEMCIMMCVQGCFCKKGYFRRSDGECVLKKHCRK